MAPMFCESKYLIFFLVFLLKCLKHISCNHMYEHVSDSEYIYYILLY